MKQLRAAVAFTSIMLASVLAVGQVSTAHAQRGNAETRVYLMRGFANVFSLGLDTLAEKLQRRGFKTALYNHVSAGSVVGEIIQNRRAGHRGPIVIIGHSLGAAAAVDMANDLSAAGISVDLVVPIDSITTLTASGTTKRIVNYYMSGGVGSRVVAGPGFKGRLRNIDVRDSGVGHIFIDKSEQVQKLVIDQVVAVSRSASPAKSKPADDDRAAESRSAPGPTLR